MGGRCGSGCPSPLCEDRTLPHSEGVLLLGLPSGRELMQLEVEGGRGRLAVDLAFSRDGKTLALAAMGGEILHWDLAGRVKLRTLKCDRTGPGRHPGSLSFSSAGA